MRFDSVEDLRIHVILIYISGSCDRGPGTVLPREFAWDLRGIALVYFTVFCP
jgi:hypothetical protein